MDAITMLLLADAFGLIIAVIVLSYYFFRDMTNKKKKIMDLKTIQKRFQQASA